ncbi:hypothetical protein GCM10017688_39710 [Streptomyces ramulosus]
MATGIRAVRRAFGVSAACGAQSRFVALASLRHCVTASLRHCVTASLRHCVTSLSLSVGGALVSVGGEVTVTVSGG